MNACSSRRTLMVIGLLLIAAVALVACGGGGGTSAPSAPTAPAAQSANGQQTFGKADCAKLISFEEIEAALRTAADVVNVVEEGTCDYEDKSGFAVLTVILASDSQSSPPCTAPDGTYLGKPVEKISGVGDNAVWSGDVQTVCFNKGNKRVQLSFGLSDAKMAAIDLARRAAARLP